MASTHKHTYFIDLPVIFRCTAIHHNPEPQPKRNQNQPWPWPWNGDSLPPDGVPSTRSHRELLQ